MQLKPLLLLIFFLPKAYGEPVILCDSSKGLELVNQNHYSQAQIEMILRGCDQVAPNDPQTLLLHGLLARKQAQQDKNYLPAIEWLEKANKIAPDNLAISQELAITYELANNLVKAQTTYQSILAKDTSNRTALLGKARIYRKQKYFNQAIAIYQHLLTITPRDVDAINGIAWVKAAGKDLASASHFFQESLKIQPKNPEALLGLSKIEQTQAQSKIAQQRCKASTGFILVNKMPPPIAEIEAILKNCDNNHINTAETQLLHGLLARQQALISHDYTEALFWLQKAVNSAASNDKGPAIELAITYEWAKQWLKAQVIYEYILAYEPTNRAALLGKGRVLRLESHYSAATALYQQLLHDNPKDIDGLNGLGWIQFSQKNFRQANDYFHQSLAIQPTNKEALIALSQLKMAEAQITLAKITYLQAHLPTIVAKKSPCDANQGLILLNQPKPHLAEINTILKRCDSFMPKDTSTLMLHALLARYTAQQGNHEYQDAISWLKLAIESAKADNKAPLIELAVTYEWANQPKEALAIYQQLLAEKPGDTLALLGQARVFRSLYRIKPSVATYAKILHQDPHNIEALNGLGESLLTNYDLDEARAIFNKALILDPKNKQTLNDLNLLNDTTKNILALSGGYYTVPPNNSEGMNLFYFRNLNATDGLTIYATHNTKQIASGFSSGPTLLPNNSLLLGYQHLVPNRYGWELSYDARQHDNLPFEHRIYGTENIYLTNKFQWFNGLRLAFPYPWNTQLFISGVTAYTPWPVNVTLTGFWAYQQIGGKSASYALDLSKEFNKRLFYDIGSAYLPNENGWEMHGRVILPTFKNQALVVECSHYFFNQSTFAIAGWRFYWA